MERQFPQNVMVKGFPTWNVSLGATLNSIPPQVHDNANPEKLKLSPSASISQIKQAGGFLLTACDQDGSVNVWDTKLKLQKLGAHNYKCHELSPSNEAVMKELLMAKQGQAS